MNPEDKKNAVATQHNPKEKPLESEKALTAALYGLQDVGAAEGALQASTAFARRALDTSSLSELQGDSCPGHKGAHAYAHMHMST